MSVLVVLSAVAFGGPLPIINGEDAATSEYPMAGAMLFDGDIQSPFGGGHYRAFMCSSTLIAPDVVLLAAHCVDPTVLTYGYGTVENEHLYWTRAADVTSLDGSDAAAALPDDAIEAWDWVYHDDWNYSALQMGLAENHDVALLFLDEAVTDVPFAYLPSADDSAQIAEGDDVEIVGWGQQIATGQFEQPPAGSFGIKQKAASFIASLNAVEMQIGAGVDDGRKCHGDSGGPTFLTVDTESPDTMRLIGVTSHSYDESDCNEVGGVDTRVDHYLDWIDREMTERCASGDRVWCDETGIPAIPAPLDTDGDGIPDLEEDEDHDGILDFEDPKIRKGCGCSTGEGGVAGWGVVAVVVALTVRRRGLGGVR
jgi:MYXO-CTERM domain-containing protein